MQSPLVQEISYQEPLEVFSKFAHQPGAIFFDSAQISQHLGRYSFIAIDPFLTLQSKAPAENPFNVLQNYLQEFNLKNHAELPPFQNGVAGFFSYDLCHYLEKFPRHKIDDLMFPDMLVGFYDLVIGFDHVQQKTWIFSSGFPEKQPYLQEMRAQQRCQWLMCQLANTTEVPASKVTLPLEKIVANFSKEKYQKHVEKIINYLYAGDVYQVNLAQRFITLLPQELTNFQLYKRLRQLSLAPFSAYINFNDGVIASASPERFLKLTGNKVETRPIKGTRRRSSDRRLDQQLALELQQSAKDHAENLMIVDLLRNDLSRVCEHHSIKVTQLGGLESYATVHHLVSVIVAQLNAGLTALDLLKATFPGGSVTGAPKIRAMQIIAELETHARGPYCGSIGYIGFNGDMDSSIIIRSFAIKNQQVSFHVGGGIVADSDPLHEYEETLIKAQALRDALTQC